MSSVVSEATYIMVSSLLDLIDKIKKRRYRKKVFKRLREAKKKVKTPPPYYRGFVKVGNRAKIIGEHTQLVVDAPYYGQTEYEYTPRAKFYATSVELTSPNWFDILKLLHEKMKGK